MDKKLTLTILRPTFSDALRQAIMEHFIMLDDTLQGLEDYDSTVSLDSYRNFLPSVTQQLAYRESLGQYPEALVCYDLAVTANKEDEKYKLGRLQCMQTLGTVSQHCAT